MDARQYETAKHVLSVFFEDNRKDHMSEDDLRSLLPTALFQYFYGRGHASAFTCQMAADDEAEMIIKHLDLLRPILEAYWSDK